eukprot:1898509-Pleurochrysis_carterae.AAC.1
MVKAGKAGAGRGCKRWMSREHWQFSGRRARRKKEKGRVRARARVKVRERVRAGHRAQGTGHRAQGTGHEARVRTRAR